MLKSFHNLTQKEKKASLLFIISIFALLVLKSFLFEKENEGADLEAVTSPVTFHSTDEQESIVDEKSGIVLGEKKTKDKSSSFNIAYNFPETLLVASHMGLEEWQQLGFYPNKSSVLANYFSKLKWLSVPEEVNQIYVLSDDEKKLLINHLKFEFYDLNSMTLEDFTAIKGVGNVLGKRILKYRDLLGGFCAKNQLYEVYGLDSCVVASVLQKTEIKEFLPPLDINNSSLWEMQKNPYLTKEEAKLIVFKRSSNPIRKIEELKDIVKDSVRLSILQKYFKFSHE